MVAAVTSFPLADWILEDLQLEVGWRPLLKILPLQQEQLAKFISQQLAADARTTDPRRLIIQRAPTWADATSWDHGAHEKYVLKSPPPASPSPFFTLD